MIKNTHHKLSAQRLQMHVPVEACAATGAAMPMLLITLYEQGWDTCFLPYGQQARTAG